jgi:hypothetical protein
LQSLPEGDWWSNMVVMIVGTVNNCILIFLAGNWW